MKLTMDRRGQFRCNWLHTHGKCGIGTDMAPVYHYRCVIETADILDQNGFIYDQLSIDEYFRRRYERQQKPLSCERLAANAVVDVKHMIENHMLKHSGMSVIYKISVTISLEENGPAQMTAEWTPETIKQVANVKKLKPAKVAFDIETMPLTKASLDNRLRKLPPNWRDDRP